jgi:hypothetical protein
MAHKYENEAVCGALQKAIADKNCKPYKKENRGDPSTISSYFLAISSDLGKDPATYLGTTTSTFTLIGKGILDPDDGLKWDFYVWYCPLGPPCLELESL